MNSYPPCVRHGYPGDADTKLRRLFDVLIEEGHKVIAQRVISIIDFDGLLWITWPDHTGDETDRSIIRSIWISIGGSDVLNLANVDDDYDYQEDFMNAP